MSNKIKDAMEESIGALVSSIVKGMGVAAFKELDKLKFELSSGFSQYADKMYNRCAHTKTIINRNSPIPLDAIYVPAEFEKTSQADIFNALSRRSAGRGARYLVRGPAGSGKSIFLRKCFIETLGNLMYGFPIFVEFRHITDLYNKDSMRLDQIIYDQISSAANTFSFNQFIYGKQQGAFTFILDGFDEIPEDLRRDVQRDINNLSLTFPRISIILSSRPAKGLSSWEDFSLIDIEPMSLPSILALVDKIDFDDEKKDGFRKELSDGLYTSNAGLLSNPLLATLMLLVYDLIGRIPSNRYLYYEMAFQVLLYEHDSMKPMYQRKLHSNLSLEELTSIFEAFCYLSYSDRRFSLSYTAIKGYVVEAADLLELEVDADSVCGDFTESLSILIEEGEEFFFIHRSFQEYFFARFINRAPEVDFLNTLISVVQFAEDNELLGVIYAMNKVKLECSFWLPFYLEIWERDVSLNVKDQPDDLLFFDLRRRWRNSDAESKQSEREDGSLHEDLAARNTRGKMLYDVSKSASHVLEGSESPVLLSVRSILTSFDEAPRQASLRGNDDSVFADVSRKDQDILLMSRNIAKIMMDNCQRRSEKRTRFLRKTVQHGQEGRIDWQAHQGA